MEIEEIENIVNNYYKELSPKLKNDISLFFCNTNLSPEQRRELIDIMKRIYIKN